MITCEYCGLQLLYKRYLKEHQRTKKCLMAREQLKLDDYFNYKIYKNEIKSLQDTINNYERLITEYKKTIEQHKITEENLKNQLDNMTQWKQHYDKLFYNEIMHNRLTRETPDLKITNIVERTIEKLQKDDDKLFTTIVNKLKDKE